jgi:4-diphosphocytidyl-2C-methyl-D-erythritol kinase
MSGSGPSVSARPEGEQTVEAARNREDGLCRVWMTRVIRIPSIEPL